MRFFPKMSVAEQEALLGPLPAVRAKLRSQMIHVILTLLMAAIVSTLTRKPLVLFPIMASSWMASIYMFAAGALPLWRIVAAVASSGVIFYVLARFFFPA